MTDLVASEDLWIVSFSHLSHLVGVLPVPEVESHCSFAGPPSSTARMHKKR